MYKFPTNLPRDSEPGVWSLQQFLLQKAEARLGRRDLKKKLCQPTFGASVPCIKSNPGGAWAVLSNNAAGYWPTALYELAHETIHLLNPVVGRTTYLEEGVAVEFSIEMSRTETNHPMEPNNNTRYRKAWDLVLQLPDGPYASAKNIRKRCGSLGNADSNSIESLFPGINKGLAKELCQECKI